MAERLLSTFPEPELERALRDLRPSIAWPTAGTAAPGLPDLATSVRVRIEAAPAPPPRGTLPDLTVRLIPWRGRPARRALVLALVALLALAALAGAVGLGLPGLRLILGGATGGSSPTAPPTTKPSASAPATLGATMGLGEPLDAHDPDGLTARAGFPVTLPTDPAIGAPEAAYLDVGRGNQVTLLWPAGPGLPATHEATVGLLLSEFEGTVNEGFFTKLIAGGTVVERVRVNGRPGFWISGQPHVLFWDGPTGTVDDARRWVGDVLLWSNGPITFRLESGLGRDEAIRIGETLP